MTNPRANDPIRYRFRDFRNGEDDGPQAISPDRLKIQVPGMSVSAVVRLYALPPEFSSGEVESRRKPLNSPAQKPDLAVVLAVPRAMVFGHVAKLPGKGTVTFTVDPDALTYMLVRLIDLDLAEVVPKSCPDFFFRHHPTVFQGPVPGNLF